MDLLIEKYKKYEPFFGGWYIKSLLGEGGYGAVFEVEKVEFDTTYKAALKIVSIPQSESELKSILSEGLDEASTATYYEDILHKMMDEINLMVKMKGHSNIVSCEDHQVIPHDGSIGWDIIIRMELLTPIVDYQKTHPFTERDVIELGIDIGEALEVCKRYKIIHRDIKPENIFVSRTDNYKLGDFGIARTMENTKGASTKAGTGRYMAPEVYRGERYNDTVDLYSLGLVLYRYLNENRLPFYPPYPQPIRYSDQEMAQEKRLSGEILPKAIHASEEITKIINKACAFKPGDRYQTAADMKNDLLQLKKIREGQTEADILNSSFSGQSENEESNTYDKTEVIRLEKEETISIFSGRNENIEFIEAKNTVKEASDSISLNERIPEESEKTVGIFSDVPKTVNDVTRNKSKKNIVVTLLLVGILSIVGVIIFTGGIGLFEKSSGEYLVTEDISEDSSLYISDDTLDDESNDAELSDTQEFSALNKGDSVTFGIFEGQSIEWDVIEADGESVLLISHNILTNRSYDQEGFSRENLVDTNWEQSEIREWLNGDFYDTSFTEDEKSRIQKVINSNPGPEDFYTRYYWEVYIYPHKFKGNTNPCGDTEDKVFLLSWEELIKYYEVTKDKKAGIYVYEAITTDLSDNKSWWWLRSEGHEGDYAMYVRGDGYVSEDNILGNYGIRPVIRVGI